MRLQIKIFSRKLTVTHCRAAGNRITQYEHVSARTELTAIIFIADTKETQKRSSFFIEVGPMYVILFFSFSSKLSNINEHPWSDLRNSKFNVWEQRGFNKKDNTSVRNGSRLFISIKALSLNRFICILITWSAFYNMHQNETGYTLLRPQDWKHHQSVLSEWHSWDFR